MDDQVLASSVGKTRPESVTFEVADFWLDSDGRDFDEWSEPVRFRFEARADGRYDLVMRMVDA